MALLSRLGIGKSQVKHEPTSASKHGKPQQQRQPSMDIRSSQATRRPIPSTAPRAQSVAMYSSRRVEALSEQRPASSSAHARPRRPVVPVLRHANSTPAMSPAPPSRSPSPSRSSSTPSPGASSSNTDLSESGYPKTPPLVTLPEEAYTIGPVHEGEPVGKEQTIGGLTAYITAPAQKCDRVVLFICDVFGWKFRNSRVMADKIAANGFIVVMPDFFQGDLIDFALPSARVLYPRWIARHPPQQVIRLMNQVLDAIHVRFRPQRIASIGYDFGGKYAITANSHGHVDAAVVGTPVGATNDDISSIQRPILFLCAEHDRSFGSEGRVAATDILASKPFKSSLVFYPGTEHGFCVRYHESRTDVAKAAKDALEKTISFLITNLA